MVNVVNWVSLGIGCIGFLIIIWGSLVSFLELSRLESGRFSGENSFHKKSLVRQHFGFYLLMGLEYMIGADIARTLVKPTLNELAVLGSLVAIRTVTSFFLNKDMEESRVKIKEA